MLEANTFTDYWRKFIHPEATEFPKTIEKVEIITLPVGLFMTLKRNGEKVSLTTRAKYTENSLFARRFYDHVVKTHGIDCNEFTVVVSHSLLPETVGRSVLIRVLSGEEELKDFKWVRWELLDTDTYKPDWIEVSDPEELELYYQRQDEVIGSSGLLIRVTQKEYYRTVSNDGTTYFRRPLEWRVTATIVQVEPEKVILRYKPDHYSYLAELSRGDQDVVDRTIASLEHPVGSHLELTFKSKVRKGRFDYRLYAARIQRVVNDLPPPEQQFVLV